MLCTYEKLKMGSALSFSSLYVERNDKLQVCINFKPTFNTNLKEFVGIENLKANFNFTKYCLIMLIPILKYCNDFFPKICLLYININNVVVVQRNICYTHIIIRFIREIDINSH